MVKKNVRPRSAPATRSIIRKTTPRRTTPTTKSGLTSLIKRVSLGQVETKRSSKYQEGVDLMHNTTIYNLALLDTLQGDGNPDGANKYPGERIGNEIIAKALSFKFYLERQSSNASSHFKVIVFQYPAAGFSVNDGTFWQGANGAGANNIMRIIDTVAVNKIKILKQVILRPQQWYTRELSLYIPLGNKKIKYMDNNSQYPQGMNIGFAIVGCDKIADSTSTKIGELNYAWKLTYKDP